MSHGGGFPNDSSRFRTAEEFFAARERAARRERWRRLDAEDLFRLEPERLRRHVYPLLRRHRLTSPHVPFSTAARHDERIFLTVFELWDAWMLDPTLDGRRVSFGEYLAARLRSMSIRLDRQEEPDLYRGRELVREPNLELDAPHGDDDLTLGDHVVRAADGGAAIYDSRLHDPREFQLGHVPYRDNLLDRARRDHPVGSVAAMANLINGIALGSVTNGRSAGWALGREDYITRAATGAYLAGLGYIDECGWPSTFAGYQLVDWNRMLRDPAFKFDPNPL